MRYLLLFISVSLAPVVFAQKVNQHIIKGNEQYRQKDYERANEAYLKALKADGNNPLARFNSGNAQQRMNQYEDAAKSYEAASATTSDPLLQSQAYYNQGLAYVRQKKLPEAIDAFKKSLRLNTNDKDARENLQKALNELRMQQQSQDDNKNKSKPPPKPKQEKNKNKLTEQQAEKLLNDLQKEEKDVQKQMQKKPQPARQLKDW